MAAWLMQESYNTICAAVVVVVDVSVESLGNLSLYNLDAIRGIIELLLGTVTLPQSPVTQLRAVGALLLVLEKNVKIFLDIVDTNIEHWIRIMLSLMNCQALSVRSIAVDFVVSLLSGIFALQGNIDSTTTMIASILPEVIAREIGLYCVSGKISTMDDVAKSVWPIRRSIADIGDANPLDDDRVDPILATILSTFSHACQAIVDGVLIELRLNGKNLCIVGVKVEVEPYAKTAFDADEESLFEAASFFRSEIAPMQRMRWLLTLKKLHASRNKWLEATECLLLCASTLCYSLPFVKDIWWPSRYEQWSNGGPLPFSVVGTGNIAFGNSEVMMFAENFLEPNGICATHNFLSVKIMSELLVRYTQDAIEFSKTQAGSEAICHCRLQLLSKDFKNTIEKIENQPLTPKVSARITKAEDKSALHKVTKFLSKTINEMNMNIRGQSSPVLSFVLMRILGRKPKRFKESTTIPTFLEWEKWCVCRLSMNSDDAACSSVETFAKPYVQSLLDDDDDGKVVLRMNNEDFAVELDQNATYIDVVPVNNYDASNSLLRVKHFVRPNDSFIDTIHHDIIVANDFPCAISRQRVLETEDAELLRQDYQ